MGFSLTKTNHFGYPHDYGNLHIVPNDQVVCGSLQPPLNRRRLTATHLRPAAGLNDLERAKPRLDLDASGNGTPKATPKYGNSKMENDDESLFFHASKAMNHDYLMAGETSRQKIQCFMIKKYQPATIDPLSADFLRALYHYKLNRQKLLMGY